ncbi:MAG: hypothetical protein AAGF07_04620 [Patescibacteria group bacterium]
MSPKILLHNLTIKGIENVPGVLNYDQRSLVLSNSGDTVITRNRVDKEYLKYLDELGYETSTLNFYVSKTSKQTYDSIFFEPELSEFLKDKSNRELSTYNLTALESNFAQQNNLQFSSRYKVAEKYGRKSYFREVCKKLDLPVAYGFEKLTNIEELINCIQQIPTPKILLRLDEGVSGAGNFLVDKKDFILKQESEKRSYIQRIFDTIPQRLEGSGITVENWFEDVIASPSLQFLINSKGETKLLSTHDQILEGEEKWFVGSKYPSVYSDYINSNVLPQGEKLGKYFFSQGFIGEFGLDIIMTHETYYFVEANIRTLGTTYPREFVKKVNNGTLEGLTYISKDVELKNFKNVTFELLIKVLETLKYDFRSKSGLLIYNTATIPLIGRFDMVLVGTNSDMVNSLIQEAQILLDKNFGLRKKLSSN